MGVRASERFFSAKIYKIRNYIGDREHSRSVLERVSMPLKLSVLCCVCVGARARARVCVCVFQSFLVAGWMGE